MSELIAGIDTIDLNSVHASILPVDAKMRERVVSDRLQRFKDLPNEIIGLAGTRISKLTLSNITTESVYAKQAWSGAKRFCAFCRTTIIPREIHVLYSIPPQDEFPYHHLHRRPCFDFILASLVDVEERPREILQQIIVDRTEIARSLERLSH